MSSPRIVAAISNVSMINGHDGLIKVAKKFGYDVQKFADGEVVLFVNKATSKIKLLGRSGMVVGYLKMPGSERIPLGAVQYIPQAFSASGQINIDKAIGTYLQNELSKKRNPNVASPLQVARALKQVRVSAEVGA